MTGTISLEKVKELRKLTGVGMTKCKSALEEAGGDVQTAVENLRKSGMAAAVKKENREAKEGIITFQENDSHIALLEVNAETDFVVKNSLFKDFSQKLADELLKTNPASLADFMAQKSPEDSNYTIDQWRALIIQKIGENIQIRRIASFEKNINASLGVYSHMAGKIVCIVEIEGSDKETDLARDIAMHVAAENPSYLHSEEIPDLVIQSEKEIALSQVKGKPEHIIGKIIQGKLEAFYNQVCLTKQKFVKDSNITITQLLNARAKETNTTLTIKQFTRWSVGA